MKINLKKTDYLYQSVKNINTISQPSEIEINEYLKQYNNSTFVGNILSNSDNIDDEIPYGVGKEFGKLQEKLCKNHLCLNQMQIKAIVTVYTYTQQKYETCNVQMSRNRIRI